MNILLFGAVIASLQSLRVSARSVDLFFQRDVWNTTAGIFGSNKDHGSYGQKSPFVDEDEVYYADERQQVDWKRNHQRGGTCLLDMNEDLPKKNEPLFLHRGKTHSIELLMPELEGRRGIIALREGESITISCPGKGNYIEATKSEVAAAYCRAGNRLSIDGKDYSSLELDCKGRPSAWTRLTGDRCAGGAGVIVEVGFEVGGWIPMIKSCHNMENSFTYYSTHTINGAILGGKVYRTTARPMFSRGENIFTFNIEAAYTQRNQLVVLSRKMGSEKAKNLLDTKKNLFMARGHLAPDADFLFSAHQFLTYFYVNVAPQWQSINAGNWLKVEDNTRKLARRLGADFEVVTGTYGVLKLDSQNGWEEIRLEHSRLPVPELFWKVVRNTQDDSCIAFVSTNNPFITSKPTEICKDVCAKNSWPVLQDDLVRGYVYCCRYEDIKRAIPEMPELTCSSALRGLKNL